MATQTQRRNRRQAIATEALNRARTPAANLDNDISAEMQAREAGYPDARARENLLTFNAWRGLGRHVRKGEKACAKVVTWIPTDRKAGDDPEGKAKGRNVRPKVAYLFHVSQTEESGR